MANEFQKDFVKNNAITKKLNVSQIIKVMLCLSLTGMLLLNVFYDTGNVPSAAHPVEFQDSSVPTFKKDINSTNRFRKEKALSTILVKSPHLDPLDYKSRDGCDFSAVVELFDPNQLEINCGNIHLLKRGKKLGAGYWRKVYSAEWKGRKVAMKLVRNNLMSRSDIVKRHVREAAVLFQLRNAPNVVHMVGWCNTTIIVEFIPHKLEDVVFNTDNQLSVERSLELAVDAAHGVEMLHQVKGGPFAHTDIQTRQLLIGNDGKLLLNDFNRMKYTGKCLLPGQDDMKCLFRTPVAKGKWRSPEEYADLNLDEKLDIYSLSVVLWTLRSREPPFEGIERDDVYKGVVENDIRPDISKMSDYPMAMQKLIQQGWQKDPLLRPTARQMKVKIQQILNEYRKS